MKYVHANKEVLVHHFQLRGRSDFTKGIDSIFPIDLASLLGDIVSYRIDPIDVVRIVLVPSAS